MGEHLIKMPDVGEGIAEAELVEWHVKVGDLVREDAVLAAVMTDKATVEIPSPVDGEVLWLGAEIGDVVAIGSPLIRLKVEGEDQVSSESSPAAKAAEPPARTEEIEAQADGAIKVPDAIVERQARSTPPQPMERLPRGCIARRSRVPRVRSRLPRRPFG
jgi:2-oxoisovalerate dehydrogenase E2 component (dihydrolipoyl transacylase)